MFVQARILVNQYLFTIQPAIKGLLQRGTNKEANLSHKYQ